MKNYSIIPALLLVCLAACKGKKNSKEDPPISAVSIIKGQLNHLDTSLYQLTRYETRDSITDTAYMKREEVVKYATPFLSLPDIANSKYSINYDEERLIEAEEQTMSITSTAKDPNSEVQKQIIIIGLSDLANGKVKSIYIDRILPAGDSTTEQKLFWEIDKYFSVANIVQKENQPDKASLTKVAWQ